MENDNSNLTSIKNEIENKDIDEYVLAESHRTQAITRLDNLLSYYIDKKDFKKVHLLSYWFEDFVKYNLEEKTFNPKTLKKYKRGSIIKANLGFNVGNEEGGLHYCVVLDKNNYISSGTLTVVPLTSIKEDKKYGDYTLNLGDEIYLHLNKICSEMSKKLSEEYKNVWKLPPEKIKQFTTDFEHIKKIEKEIAKMKKGSIALVNQITTISKQRIYDPKTSKDILSNLRVSGKTLDLIDEKIEELFLKK